jgi:hypothetical protein
MVWSNSIKADQYDGLPLPEENGWLIDNGNYYIDWEAKEVVTKVQDTLDWLSKGCHCKTGCTTNRCACIKKGNNCGAGCECKHCSNIQSVTQPQEEDDVSESEEEAEESETDQNNETESEEIETEVICDFIQNYI